MTTGDGRCIVLDPTFFIECVSIGALFQAAKGEGRKGSQQLFSDFGYAFEDDATDILGRMYPHRPHLVHRLACNIKGRDGNGRDFEVHASLTDVSQAALFDESAFLLRRPSPTQSRKYSRGDPCAVRRQQTERRTGQRRRTAGTQRRCDRARRMGWKRWRVCGHQRPPSGAGRSRSKNGCAGAWAFSGKRVPVFARDGAARQACASPHGHDHPGSGEPRGIGGTRSALCSCWTITRRSAPTGSAHCTTSLRSPLTGRKFFRAHPSSKRRPELSMHSGKSSFRTASQTPENLSHWSRCRQHALVDDLTEAGTSRPRRSAEAV